MAGLPPSALGLFGTGLSQNARLITLATAPGQLEGVAHCPASNQLALFMRPDLF